MPEQRDPWAGHTVLMDLPERAPFEAAEPLTRPFERPSAPKPTEADALAPKVDDFASVTVIAPAPSLDVIAAFAAAPHSGALRPQPCLGTVVTPASTLTAPALLNPGSAFAGVRARLSDEFRRTPRSMRLTLFALPVVAWAALSLGQPADAPRPVAKIAAAASSASVVTPATAVPLATLAAKEPAGLPVNAGNPVGTRCLQARAADAAARGAYAEAATQYDELARLNPTHAEFATAARILRAKRSPPEPEWRR